MRVLAQPMSDRARPTPNGYRRRPRTRGAEQKRPGTLHYRGFGFSLAWLLASEQARRERGADD